MIADPHPADPRPALRRAVRDGRLSGWYHHVDSAGMRVWVLIPADPEQRSITYDGDGVRAWAAMG